ncbi:MAG: DUF58 domain-containing protein [Clostridia bacterium]|nr:DUF58 domain-containing protein [Clostridia bacterium]
MLLFFLLLIAVAAAAEHWSLLHGMDGVTHRHFPDRPLVDPEEPFHLVTQVKNASRRFVPFVRLRENVPFELTFSDDVLTGLTSDGRSNTFSSTLYLMPRQVWQRELEVKLPRRGRYLFRGGAMQGGDFLGLSETVVYQPAAEEIIVAPAPSDDPRLPPLLGGFLGDRSVNRFIMEDPVLTLGFRDYTGREPMKSISWPQSARAGRLMVKNYDHTLEPTATVLLSVQTQKDDPLRGEKLEACFSLARSVCETLEEKHIPYRFLSNIVTAGAMSRWSNVAEGLGPAHLFSILEGLGRATCDCIRPFAVTLERASRTAQQGRTHILILPERLPALEREIRLLEQRTGTRALVLTPTLPEEKEADA